MNIKKARKATPFTVAVAIAIWILAGCSTSAPATTHTAAHPSATASVTPAQQMEAWKNGPGYAAFSKLDTDLNSGGDLTAMTPAQIRQTLKDVRAAEKYPIPASVDPGGYYLDALIHFGKGLRAAQNNNVFGAITQMEAGTSSAQHFVTEVKKVS